jgi:hypothetical protein
VRRSPLDPSRTLNAEKLSQLHAWIEFAPEPLIGCFAAGHNAFADRTKAAAQTAATADPKPILGYPCAISFLAKESGEISHLSQYDASFATDLSVPVNATYPSGRTRTMEGELPKCAWNVPSPGDGAIW